MDWKSFFVEMTKSLSWPITVGLTVYFLRDFISGLVPRISKFRHKDTEIEFAETMGAIKERAENIDLAGIELLEELKEEKDRLEKLSLIIPRSALLQSWGLIDREVSDYLLEIGASTDEVSLKTSDVMDKIKSLGLSKSESNTFLNLRKIMKSVTGPEKFELAEDEVESYIELAVDLVGTIRNARSNKALQRTNR
tara:strand:+ start:21 stop:605 length:585 start_codon:yes stop_codon:yes gene_type:complete